MGIKHLSALKPSELLTVLGDFANWDITEKIDGANLQVGKIDGKLYVERSLKGSTIKYFTIDQWPKIDTWHVNFKQAHQALLSSGIAEYMEDGDIYDIEVLGDPQSNVIDYKFEGSRIVFLRTLAGNPNYRKFLEHPPVVTTNVVSPTSDSTYKIIMVPSVKQWQFAEVKKYSPTDFKIVNWEDRISTLNEFLDKKMCPYLTNREIIELKLNSKPDNLPEFEWKNHKNWYSEKRDSQTEELKELVYNNFTCHLITSVAVANTFGTVSEFEGWVVKSGDILTKIVDSKRFSRDNLNAWHDGARANFQWDKFIADVAATAGYKTLGFNSTRAKFKREHSEKLSNIVTTLRNNILNNRLNILEATVSTMLNMKGIIGSYEYVSEKNYTGHYSKYTIEKYNLFFADMFQRFTSVADGLFNSDPDPLIRYLLKIGDLNDLEEKHEIDPQ